MPECQKTQTQKFQELENVLILSAESITCKHTNKMSYKCVHSKVHFYTIAALHTMEKASVEIASFPDPTKKERVG